MGSVKVKCSRCGKTMHNSEFDNHICKNMRETRYMPTDLLDKIIKYELTEEEAWKIADKRPELQELFKKLRVSKKWMYECEECYHAIWDWHKFDGSNDTINTFCEKCGKETKFIVSDED